MRLHLHAAILLLACAWTKGVAIGDPVDAISAEAHAVDNLKIFPSDQRALPAKTRPQQFCQKAKVSKGSYAKGAEQHGDTGSKSKSKKGSKSKTTTSEPSFVKAFTEATFIPGGQNGSDDTVEEEDGVEYRVVADVTTIETGIVSLTEASPFLVQVTCSDDESVLLTFKEPITEEDLANMFPIGSMLVVDGATHGSCFLGLNDDGGKHDGSAYWTDKFPDSFEDGYLFIERITLGACDNEAVIRGSRSSFFFMFDEANISVEPIPTTEIFTNVTTRDRELRSVTKDFHASADFPKGKSPLKVRAGVTFHVFAGMGFKVKWKLRRGITLTVSFAYEVTTTQEVGVYLSKGDQTKTLVYPLIKYPLFAIPEIRLLRLLKLTSPKLGAYIEVDYFVQYALKINSEASAVASNTVATGKKELEFFVEARWRRRGRRKRLRAGVRKKTLVPAKKEGASFDVTVPKVLTAKAKVFTGIQPGVWLYLFGLGRAGVFQRSGLELDAVASTSALPPAKNGASLGPCNVCHSFHSKVDLLVKNLSYEFSMRFKFKKWFIKINKHFSKKGTLPGELRVDLFLACALARKDETQCKSKCCKKGYNCVGGTCRRALPPTRRTPTRSPTPRPVIVH